MVFRVFNEAARNLDSRPSTRADRVEACRPRGCCLRIVAREGRIRKRRGPGPLEEPSPFSPRRAVRFRWRGLTPQWPRSLRLGSASGFNLARAPAEFKPPTRAIPQVPKKKSSPLGRAPARRPRAHPKSPGGCCDQPGCASSGSTSTWTRDAHGEDAHRRASARGRETSVRPRVRSVRPRLSGLPQ
jgi:hypothetical protein